MFFHFILNYQISGVHENVIVSGDQKKSEPVKLLIKDVN